ncbi:GntR family transcriptional regulator [Microbacterium fluvii]|uniref:GntR family transcriptional regulator n=1 Tax=Microbacterium fluvii TaxID=415215 RepID=A0ABW2HEL5_9MICO|nr:GntR family transcriptional regulator [Microbacterium fluvii]MCU4673331.1 GntR family transcriptional regulator [Microbacterium fluvii]
MIENSTLRPVARAGSLAEQAYRAIRSSIADGSLAPGSAITERQLASTLEVSPTPVREALRKLEHEGLVVRSDARRLTVAPEPVETVEELRQVEIVLRAMEARFAARKIGEPALERLRGILARAQAGVQDLPPEDLLVMAREYDAEVAEAAENPGLRRIIESFTILGGDDRNHLDLVLVGDPAWRRMRLQQHRDLFAALEAHDEDLAERITRQNARSALSRLDGDGHGADHADGEGVAP